MKEAVAPGLSADIRTTFWWLFAANLTSSAMTRVCDPMLPALAGEFGVSTGQAAVTVSAYAVAYGVLQLFFGPLGDRFGKRRVVGFAALASVVGTVMAMLSTSLDMLVAARVLTAATAAGIIPLILAWVGDTVPYEQRQAALARFLTASIGGMIVGQWASGLVTDWFGWRWVFAGLALMFAAAGLKLCLDPSVRAEQRDPAAAGSHLQGLRQVLSVGWARWILLAGALEAALVFSVTTFLPASFVHREGLSLGHAAGVVAIYGAGGIVYAATARRMVAWLGETGLVLVGGWAVAVAWLVLSPGLPWALAMPVIAVAGVGYYMLHSTLTVMATQMVPQARGTSVALFAASMFSGISLGVAFGGVVVDRVGYTPLFAGFGIAMVVFTAVLAASLRRRQRQLRSAI